MKHNGFFSLYSGIGAVCIGVGPEKAIKLTVNDFCRQQFADDKGHLPLSLQFLSGGMAGAAQTVFTNPLEIVKIRMQLNPSAKLIHTVKDVGVLGLYKGMNLMYEILFIHV